MSAVLTFLLLTFTEEELWQKVGSEGTTTTMTLQASTMFYSRLQPRLSTGPGTQLACNTCLLSHDWIKDVTEGGAAAGSVSHHDFARTCCVTRGESPPPGPPSSHPQKEGLNRLFSKGPANTSMLRPCDTCVPLFGQHPCPPHARALS